MTCLTCCPKSSDNVCAQWCSHCLPQHSCNVVMTNNVWENNQFWGHQFCDLTTMDSDEQSELTHLWNVSPTASLALRIGCFELCDSCATWVLVLVLLLLRIIWLDLCWLGNENCKDNWSKQEGKNVGSVKKQRHNCVKFLKHAHADRPPKVK